MSLAAEGWVRVCALGELLPGESAVAFDGDTAILVVNIDGAFFALEDRCSHADFELSAGPVVDGQVECVLHGARFDLKTGHYLTLPATANLARYTVITDATHIWIAPAEAER